MDSEDLSKFVTNRKWFNQFLKDINQLFSRIARFQKDELGTRKTEYYYRKYNDYPQIPRYCMMAQRTDTFAIQIIAVFSNSLIKLTDHLVPEPSFVIIRHSKPRSALSFKSYGNLIFRNEGITAKKLSDRVFAGDLPNGTKYQAFQIPFSSFQEGRDINEAIQSEIIDVIKILPDFGAIEP